jgi:hypothetical protein
MTAYNRTLLSDAEFVSVKPYLQLAFREFTPRSHFIKDNKAVEKHNHEALDTDEQPNLVSFPTISYPHEVPGIASFSELFSPCPVYELLNEKFHWVNRYVAERVVEAKTTFITFSTDITGAKIGVKHLHSLLNGDRCNVWSFAVPLYIDPTTDLYAKFWYNSQANLFPPRYYVDYARIKKLNIEYTAFQLPKDGKILSIRFDGSRAPHYIDYTPHLYAFIVFDGVTFKEDINLGQRYITELL